MTPSKFATSVRLTLQRLVRALLLLVLAGACAAWADPPGRIGRVADVQGPVWLWSPDQGDWVAADLNRPLTSGDRLSTERGGRAELRIGSTTLRIDGGTELEMLQLDDTRMALQLHGGTVSATLRNAESAAQFEVRTDQGSFLTQAPGHYRFDQFGDASDGTVQAGQALYQGPGSALPIYPGQRAEFWLASPTSAQYTLGPAVIDAFAQWDGDRERIENRVPVARYVSPEMTGVEDLNAYGEWIQTPDDGTLWLPNDVPAGWVPYGAGHWTWMAPWGWTWIDDMRWGFAPFHYGRWVQHGGRWGWAPGAYAARPVYAPALVGWIGAPRGRPGAGPDGRGGPPVGWFPLAPREVYVPPYRVSANYVRNVNITHVSNIANLNLIVNQPERAWEHADFRNRRLPQAITTVPGSVFAGHQPVAPAAERWRAGPQGREPAATVGRGGAAAGQNVTLVAPPVAAPPAGNGQAGRPGFDPRHAGVPPAPGHVEPAAQVLRPGERVGAPDRGVAGGRPAFQPPPVPTGPAVVAPAAPVAAQPQERRGFQGDPRASGRAAPVEAPLPQQQQPLVAAPPARIEPQRNPFPQRSEAQQQPQQQQAQQRTQELQVRQQQMQQQAQQQMQQMQQRQAEQQQQAQRQQAEQQQQAQRQQAEQQGREQQMQQRQLQERQQQMQARPPPVQPAAPAPQIHAPAPPAPAPAVPAAVRPDERMRGQPERDRGDRAR